MHTDAHVRLIDSVLQAAQQQKRAADTHYPPLIYGKHMHPISGERTH
jgi:hypothetical protein